MCDRQGGYLTVVQLANVVAGAHLASVSTTSQVITVMWMGKMDGVH